MPSVPGGGIWAIQEVLQQAKRALAYAWVYADGNPEMLAKLDAIQLGKKPRAASKTTPGAEGEAPRRRGRKPKALVEAEAKAQFEDSPVEGQA